MTSEAAKPRAKIRKIFKKGDTYLCGLCGKSYDSLTEAESCLRADSKALLAEAGAQQMAPKRYRCSLCKRIHGSIDEAKACSIACRSKSEARIALEERAARSSSIEDKIRRLEAFAKDPSAIEALRITQAQMQATPKVTGSYKPKVAQILAGENIKFQREKNMFRCLKCRQKYSAADDARQCFDAHGDSPVNSGRSKSSDHRYTLDKNKFRCTKCERLYHIAADAIHCWEGHTPLPVEKKREEETNPAFYRDGAKYVCRTCNKKYFSRDEVLSCFQGPHPDQLDTSMAVAETAKELEPVKPKVPKKDESEIYYRDGAKYVCRGCSKKYFSKDETLQCFAGHKESDNEPEEV
jgi:hypothetical protein